MFFIIALLLGSVSFIFRKSKFIFGIWALLFVILFGWNTYNPDYLSYASIYRLISLGTYDGKLGDLGYISLMRVSIDNHLLFQTFLQVIAIVTVSILFYAISKFSEYRNLVCAFILFYPLTISIVQLRFFIAYTLVFAGLYFLNKNRWGKVIFIIFIMVATAFHFSSIIFISLLLTQVKSFQNILISLLGFLLALFALNYFGSVVQIPLISQALQKYFFSNIEFKGVTFILRVIFFRLTPIMILYALYKYFKAYFTDRDAFLMKSVDIILIVSMFFEFVDSEFERFARLGYILFYIIVLNVCSRMKLQTNRIAILLLLVFVSFLNFWFQNFYRSSIGVKYFESVFKAIFENNLLLQ